ncbi:MAG: hypothetical protein KJ007_12830, partial [Burkholderiales bacterium]|nr:hypothetical protein [Burkholderiales bacterium]
AGLVIPAKAGLVIPAKAGLVIPAKAGIQSSKQKNPSASGDGFSGPVALAGFVERPQAVGSNRRWSRYFTRLETHRIEAGPREWIDANTKKP